VSEKTVEISKEYLLWIDERHNRLREENKRLNNIINELEKYFEQEGFWHSLDKIKELKEKYEILDKGE